MKLRGCCAGAVSRFLLFCLGLTLLVWGPSRAGAGTHSAARKLYTFGAGRLVASQSNDQEVSQRSLWAEGETVCLVWHTYFSSIYFAKSTDGGRRPGPRR